MSSNLNLNYNVRDPRGEYAGESRENEVISDNFGYLNKKTGTYTLEESKIWAIVGSDVVIDIEGDNISENNDA
jgi:hypothetical protein